MRPKWCASAPERASRLSVTKKDSDSWPEGDREEERSDRRTVGPGLIEPCHNISNRQSQMLVTLDGHK